MIQDKFRLKKALDSHLEAILDPSLQEAQGCGRIVALRNWPSEGQKPT
jgi:hypothetical protein